MRHRHITLLFTGLFLLLGIAVAQAQTNDHLKCYQIKDPVKLDGIVDLTSPEFGMENGCKISKAKYFCVPATKTVISAQDKVTHLPITPLPVTGPNPGDRICYKLKCPEPFPPDTQATDQFGTRTLIKFKTAMLCAPAVTGTEYCGDGVVNGNEQCDGTSDAACPGTCRADCTCPGICPTPGPTATAGICPTSGPTTTAGICPTPGPTATAGICPTSGPTTTAGICPTPGPTTTAGICPTPGPTSTATPPGPTATATPVPHFVDNGDGTVTDNQTGLQWEKKVAGSGCLHCAQDGYTWSPGGNNADGTAFTSFLGRLTAACTSADGTTITGGFAGHCDWRLPTSAELQTILLAPYPCGTSPCIDPIFGPTAASNYWSSTTFANGPGLAWGVVFGTGDVVYDGKSGPNYVRAVRGGS